MSIKVSTAWKNAIQAQFRYPAYLKLVLSVQPPGLREGAQVQIESGLTESITSPDAIMDGSQSAVEPVATFEPNRWSGDGSMYLPSESASKNKLMGWWSSSCSVTSITITFEFDKVYSFPGMSAVWDTETNSWPKKVSIVGYKSDGTEIGSYSTENIDSTNSYFNVAFDDCKVVVMTVEGWSRESWRARINEVIFGIYMNFSNNNVPSASLSATSSLLSAELPKLGVKLTINNYDQTFDPMLEEGYSKYLAERQIAELSWGFSIDGKTTEWLNSWPLYLSAWKIPADSPTVELTTTSRLSFLTTSYSKGVYTGATRSFREMALTVLENSGIIKNYDAETPWEFDSVMSTLYTRAPEPDEAANAVLQLIANATGCMLDIDPETNYIRFRSSCVDSDYTIDKLQQIGDPSFTIADRLKSVSVGLRTFATRDVSEKVYSFEGHISGSKILDVKFDNDYIVINPVATVTGATISSQVYYARRAIITIVASASGSDVTLTISGNIVDESTTFIQTYNNPDVESGIEVEVDNPLITEIATLNRVAEVTEAYYLRRKSVKVSYTGYPELETGDMLGFNTKYGSFDADVEGVNLEFNGGFSGTLSVLTREASS